MTLDPRSLIAMAFVMSALMAVVLGFMRRHYPSSIAGLGYWAAAPAVWLVATVLFGTRGVIHPLLSVALANVLLMLGAILFYMGCRRFFGHAERWGPWLALLIGAGMAFGVMALYSHSYSVRLMLFTSLMIVIYGTNLAFLLRHASKRLPVRLAQVVLSGHLIVLCIRFITTLMGMGGESLLEATPLQSLYIAAYVLTVLMLSIAAVLMATDKLVTELEHLATHDSLTQTLNRRALFARCHEEIERCGRTGRGPALIMLDLDHFKRLNDTHGHQHGDAVLAHFAQSVRAVLRRADRLGRYGGEEFMVLLPETSADEACAVAQRIHASATRGHPLDCTVSIGVSAWGGCGDSLDAMLSRADAALYRAKAQGRNQTCTM